MSKRLSLEELKKEYVGKTFTFLTVLDIVRKDGAIRFICKCKCGKLHTAYYKKILSGNTKSCGCYHHSKEKSDLYSKWCKEHQEEVAKKSKKYKQWCSENKDKIKEQGDRHSQYYKDNPEVGKLAGEKYSKWCNDNPDKVKKKAKARSRTLSENTNIQLSINKKLSEYYKENPDKMKSILSSKINSCTEIRMSSDYSKLIEVLHPDYIDPLIKGVIKSDSKIKTRCPICGKYAEHTFNNVFRLCKANFKNGSAPLCIQCKSTCSSSSNEKEIANYIATFYSGECIRNTRDIVSPLELDLYYPEKKIAIEFNGDYWHSDEFKDKDYHYNKFIMCRSIGITLVSIFEYEWDSNANAIKAYLYDLFNDKENSLSIIGSCIMSNNYPLPSNKYNINDYIENYYIHGDYRVFTCGYSHINYIV